MERLDRFRGAMVGLAVGDALGVAVEFAPPSSFPPVTTITGGGRFRLPPGDWTDDTALALCLAESLISVPGFDPLDQLARYLRWYRTGHLSCNGMVFTVGPTTKRALRHFEQTGAAYPDDDSPQVTNGSLMRLAPVPLFFAADPVAAIVAAGESSATTHPAAEAIDACRYFAGLIVGAVAGATKAEVLAPRFAPAPSVWDDHPLHPAIDAVASGSFRHKAPPAIRAGILVVEALEAALWAFATTETFADGALAAVNLGDDADTVGAIYGQLAGAYYGERGIPAEWRAVIAKRSLIEGFAGELYELSNTPDLAAPPPFECAHCARARAATTAESV